MFEDVDLELFAKRVGVEGDINLVTGAGDEHRRRVVHAHVVHESTGAAAFR